MAIRDLVQKTKNIFNGGGNNTTSIGGSRFQQLIHLFTGDNCGSRTYTPVEMMKEYKSWIYSCSNINAAGVASTPLRLYATTQEGESNKYLHKNRVLDGKEIKALSKRADFKALSKITPAVEVVEIIDHPILDLLRNFNDERNYYESLESTSIGLDMIGNSYWYMDFKGMTTPQDLYILMPQYMTVVPGKTKLVKGYLYDKSGNNTNNPNKLVKFRSNEIIHFLTPNPNSQYYGLGPAQAAAMAIERNDLIDTSENSLLKNKARADFIVNYKAGKLDSATKKDVQKMWNNTLRGPRKNGKIAVMDEDFDLKALPGLTPDEMRYLDGRVWTLKEIAAIYGVPYSMLDSSDTKKATSESAKLWHSQNALVPRLKRIEEKLNEKLVPYYDDRLFLAFDDVIPENVEQQTSTNNSYVGSGVLSINEVRRSLGMAGFPDEVYERPFAGGSLSAESVESVESVEEDNKGVDDETEV